MIKKQITWLILIQYSVFIIMFILLSYFNRPAADDFYYAACVPEKGIFTCVSDIFTGYSARWAAYTLAAVIIPSDFLFHIFPVLLLIGITYVSGRIINLILEKLTAIKLNLIQSLTAGQLSALILFYTSFSVSESWFWMIQVCTYLMSILAQLVLFLLILSDKKQIPLLIISSLFIGGSSESYAVIILFTLILAFLYRNKLIDRFKLNSAFTAKILVSFATCLISFLFMMSSAGNTVRYAALPHLPVSELTWMIVKTWIKALLLKPSFAGHYYLLFGIFIFAIGQQYPESKISLSEFLRSKTRSFLLLSVLVLVLILPATIVMSGPPPDRAMMQTSFVIATYLMWIFFDAGRKLKLKLFKPLALIQASLIITAVLLFNLFYQTAQAYTYTTAFDLRIQWLNELKVKGNKDLTDLEPLPKPGMLYSAEISDNEKHFTNTFLKNYLKLEFDIKKKSH
ncbi:MAG: DUF6056 family protein [Bacteroidia bacterium]|nr:hypothetical protein [Bacteroidia bacterium]MCZ2277960.1 DUF6056 family protein [Bacteroidia bacterium]